MRFLLASLFVLLPLSAQAVVIELDPGPVGTSSFILDLGDFGDLNDTPVDGGSLSIDFVFSDMKHVEYQSDLGIGRATLMLSTNRLGALSEDFGGTSFLANESGDAIVESFRVNRSFIGNSPPGLSWQAVFKNLDDIVAHGVRFDVTLPNWTTDEVLITGGSLFLVGGPGGEFVVGDGEPPGPVPEPSGIFLLGLALLGWTSRKDRTPKHT